VFALRHLESMTLGEIAAAMEISLSTVKRTHARAAIEVERRIASDRDLAGFLEEGQGPNGT
jgi:DNA-directed RNA polymerase specialized sigma24 family protein